MKKSSKPITVFATVISLFFIMGTIMSVVEDGYGYYGYSGLAYILVELIPMILFMVLISVGVYAIKKRAIEQPIETKKPVNANSHASQLNYSRNFSLKENSSTFGKSTNTNHFTTTDENHGEHFNYQLSYSKNQKMTHQEKAQMRREAIELATIKDKPLSEAERNVLYGK